MSKANLPPHRSGRSAENLQNVLAVYVHVRAKHRICTCMSYKYNMYMYVLQIEYVHVCAKNRICTCAKNRISTCATNRICTCMC